jgi:SAM-dependent methyltransferase
MSENTIQDPVNDIRKEVRNHYGQIAESYQGGSSASCGCAPAGSSCCQSSGSVQIVSPESLQLYEADLDSLPVEVTGLSLGCGDPVTLASLQPGQVVLDLGSGGGIDCFLAARQVGPGGYVIGVDMTSAMLEKARQNKARLGIDNVEFRLGEIEHLPVADASVDVVISNCVINLSPDKPQVLAEAYRVLRPGGRLAVSDIVTHGPLPDAIKKDLSAWAGCISGALDQDEYTLLLKEAGFSEVTVLPQYWDEATVQAGREQVGDSVDLQGYSDEMIARTVFSARITAVK